MTMRVALQAKQVIIVKLRFPIQYFKFVQFLQKFMLNKKGAFIFIVL